MACLWTGEGCSIEYNLFYTYYPSLQNCRISLGYPSVLAGTYSVMHGTGLDQSRASENIWKTVKFNMTDTNVNILGTHV